MPEVIQRKCQQCGGQAGLVGGSDYLSCPYCGSVAVLNADPRSKDGIVPTGETLTSECPCCTLPLKSGRIEQRTVLYCDGCMGVLLKRSDFTEVLEIRKRTDTSQASGCVHNPIHPDELLRTLRCPSCRTRMETHPYYGPGNVVMDSCHDCSLIWLDHGELARLATAGRVRDDIRREASGDCLSQAAPELRGMAWKDDPIDNPVRSLFSYLLSSAD